MFPKNLEVTLVLLYAIPSIFLYILLICIILKRIKKEPFSSPFFKLFVLNGVFDIISWTMTYLSIRVATASWFYWFYEMMPKSGILPTFLIWVFWYSVYAEITTFFFITLNRFTSIFFLFDSNKIWKKFFPISILIIVLIPLPFTWHLIGNGGKIWLRNSSDIEQGYSFDAPTATGYEPRNSLYVFYFFVIIGTSCFLMNLGTIFTLIIRRKSTLHADNQHSTKENEIKLFIFSILIFIFIIGEVVINFIFQTSIATMSDETFYLIFGISSYFIDALYLAPPWFLIFLSKITRQELFQTVGLTKLDVLFVRNGNIVNISNQTNSRV